MPWYAKAFLVGAGAALARGFIDRELQARGVEGSKRDALLGGLELIAFVAIAKAAGDDDGNVATPA
jgi:hypothetical protein